MHNFKKTAIILLLLAALPVTGLAAPDAGSILRQYEQQLPKPSSSLPEPESKKIVPPSSVLPEKKEVEDSSIKTVMVRAIHFSDEFNLLPQSELYSLVQDAIDRRLEFKDLQALAERVTRHLKKQGWFLAHAYLPRQDVTAGDIEIVISAGKIDGSGKAFIPHLHKTSRIDPELLRKIAANAVSPGTAIHEDDLTRAVLLMNDLPGIDVRARLEPGSEKGSTSVHLDVKEGPLLNVITWLDNYGSYDTGTGQINGYFNLNDLSGRGDQISLMATHSEGLDLGHLGYMIPLGSDGLKLNLGYSAMTYTTLTQLGRAAGLEGQSQITNISLGYPFIRSRTSNVYTRFTYNSKFLKDDSIAGTLRDKHNQTLALALNGDRLDKAGGGGLNFWRFGLTSGILDLSGVAADKEFDAATYRTNGRFDKFNYYFSRLQRLPGQFTMFADLTGQQAAGNLDSSEKMYLGGPGGVRAYSGSEAGGDNAQLFSLELRTDWPTVTPLGTVQFQTFYDVGHVNLHKSPNDIPIPTATGKNSYTISGAGLGFSLTRPGRYIISALWAHSIGDNPGRRFSGDNADSDNNASRIWLQGMLWF